MEALSGFQIISIIGRQGSGKTTIGKRLAQKIDAMHFEASQVVRDVCGNLPRSEMPKTNERTKDDPGWLGRAIAEQITSGIAVRDGVKRAVITGVREAEVHETFKFLGSKPTVYALFAEPEVRYERLLGIKCNSFKEFLDHELNERIIGLDTLLYQEYPTFLTSHETDPYEIVDRIAEMLEHTGVIDKKCA